MKLTDAFAAQVLPPAKDYVIHRDDDQPGFGLKVRASGSKTWVYEGRVFGKLYRRDIGKIQIYTSKAARMIAREIAGELRQGIDRNSVARERAKEDRAEVAAKLADALSPHLDTAIDDYVANANIKPATRVFYSELGRRELAPWANVKVKDITPDLVREIYEKVSATVSMNRATKAVKFIATICKANNLESPIPQGFKFPKPKVRMARLEPSDGIKVWSALNNRTASRRRAFLVTLLLTGCRAGEAMRLMGEDVDLEANTITLIDTKNGTDHKVYAHQAVIDEIRPYVKAGEHVFGTALDSGAARKYTSSLEGTPKFSNHDLRKCFAITAVELGIPYPVIKRALNHSTGDVTLAHYAQATPSQLRACWEAVANFYIGGNHETDTGASEAPGRLDEEPRKAA